MGRELWLGLDAVPWLVGALNECIENLTSSETEIGPDSLRVREEGQNWTPRWVSVTGGPDRLSMQGVTFW